MRILTRNDGFSIKDNSEFMRYKGQILSLRNELLFPLFRSLFNLYTKTYIMLFQKDDPKYWDCAFFVFQEIYKNREFSSLLLYAMNPLLMIKLNQRN